MTKQAILVAACALALTACGHSLPSPSAKSCTEAAIVRLRTEDMQKMATACRIWAGAQAKSKAPAEVQGSAPWLVTTHHPDPKTGL